MGTAAMGSDYTDEQRREYLTMSDRLGRRWVEVFAGNTEFYSAAYWDLLSGLWRNPGPVRKTEALRMMTAVRSAHTAGKYVETALRHGLIVEMENPEDARSRLIVLSPGMRNRLDGFFDTAIDEIRRAGAAIERGETAPAP
jgi:hypothetical protein